MRRLLRIELSKAVATYQKEVDEEVKRQLAERKKQLDEALVRDVEQNADSIILSKIAKQKADIKAKLTKETKKGKR